MDNDKIYKILLVDDEEEVRRSMAIKIEWEKLGFEVVGEAENGVDAIDKIEQLAPDLVLTDIRMPYMDGITLAGEIAKFYPATKVMFFSGYDDFEYAQKAIKLNIVEYILKPVNAEELSNILKKIKKNLDLEYMQLKDSTAMKESFIKNLPILRENFLKNLVGGRIPPYQINELMKEYRIDLVNSDFWSVAVLKISDRFKNRDINKLSLSAKHVLENMLKGRCSYVSFYGLSSVIVIMGMSEKRDMTVISSALVETCRECSRLFSVDASAGLGEPVDSLLKVQDSYRQAKDAAGYRRENDLSSVIYIKDIVSTNSSTASINEQEEMDFVNAIKEGDAEAIKETVEKLSERITPLCIHSNQYQALAISAFNMILKIMETYEMDRTKVFGNKDYYESLMAINGAEDIKAFLLKYAVKISENMDRECKDSTQNLVADAKAYIEKNYSDGELNLEKICDELHISTSYFSTVFKKEMGESFTSYLTSVRMQRAKELLLETDEKTYQIAKEVGYYEPNYFGYVFKKTYGMSPNKFRGK